MRAGLAALVVVTLAACPPEPPAIDSGVDAGLDDAGGADAGAMDAGPGADAGMDAGSDAGLDDAGVADAGSDAGLDDAGVIDAGVIDAGLDDAGVIDAGVIDAGVIDAGVIDAGPGDAGSLFGYPLSPRFGEVIFNEVLMDGTTDGDPNGDGDADPVEDQFVELVNVGSGPVALGGYRLVVADLPNLPRHTFAAFSLPAGQAVVVFGGGDAPPATATTTFFVANAADPGIPFGLHLSQPTDTLVLLDASGGLVAAFCYGSPPECPLNAAADESLTRAPDLTGTFAPHRAATGSGGEPFSVGTRLDGGPF